MCQVLGKNPSLKRKKRGKAEGKEATCIQQCLYTEEHVLGAYVCVCVYVHMCVCVCVHAHVRTCTQSCILACTHELLLGVSTPNIHPRARARLRREKCSLTIPSFSLNKHSLTCSRRNVARTTEYHSREATSTLFTLHMGRSLKGSEAWVIIPAPPFASSVALDK